MENSSQVSEEFAESRMYEIPSFAFESELAGLVIELERLRGNFGRGDTPTRILFELHTVFQVLMSLVSARIEGNRTTILEAVDVEANQSTLPQDQVAEYKNISAAMSYIDSLELHSPISHALIQRLHEIAVTGLKREGDPNPGAYRSGPVKIGESNHTPPPHVAVHAEMSRFLTFANQELETRHQLVHAAIAHHRFLWIHPFTNGNGRVSRLLTYLMLRKHGVVSANGLRTVNPTAVFGNDRDGYYSALAAADDLSDSGTIAWCTYFASGLTGDLQRLNQFQNFNVLMERVLKPTVNKLVDNLYATPAEGQALIIALSSGGGPVKAGQLEPAFPGTATQRSQMIKSMLEKKLLETDDRGPRFYRVPLSKPPLLRALMRQLDEAGYVPAILGGEAMS